MNASPLWSGQTFSDFEVIVVDNSGRHAGETARPASG